MFVFKRDVEFKTEQPPAGHWRPCIAAHRRKRKATVTCPNCETSYALTIHIVSQDGLLAPGISCPKCSFKQFAKLENWDFGVLR